MLLLLLLVVSLLLLLRLLLLQLLLLLIVNGHSRVQEEVVAWIFQSCPNVKNIVPLATTGNITHT